MFLEENVFLNGEIIVLLLATAVINYIFFRNSRDWGYVTFILYILFESIQIVPALESILFGGDAPLQLQDLLTTLFICQFTTWYLLAFQLLPKERKSLTIIWCIIAGATVAYLFFLQFIHTKWMISSERKLIDKILNYAFILTTLTVASLSTVRHPKEWKYNLAYCAFVLAFAIYFLLTQIIPSLPFQSLVSSVLIFRIPLGFTVVLLRYRGFLRDAKRSLHPTYTPNRKVAARIVQSQEEERERIARDLHDQLGSTLATIKMQMQSYAYEDSRIAQALSLIDKASEDVRNIAHDLMPKDFELTDLHTILQSLFHRLNNQSGIRFSFLHTEVVLPLSKQFELVLFRIILELVTNIVKHSKATEATVQLVYHQDKLDLVVEDNGQGFNTKATTGLGLRNIQSRAAYLKGKLHIDSSAKGTTAVVSLPYE